MTNELAQLLLSRPRTKQKPIAAVAYDVSDSADFGKPVWFKTANKDYADSDPFYIRVAGASNRILIQEGYDDGTSTNDRLLSVVDGSSYQSPGQATVNSSTPFEATFDTEIPLAAHIVPNTANNATVFIGARSGTTQNVIQVDSTGNWSTLSLQLDDAADTVHTLAGYPSAPRGWCSQDRSKMVVPVEKATGTAHLKIFVVDIGSFSSATPYTITLQHTLTQLRGVGVDNSGHFSICYTYRDAGINRTVIEVFDSAGSLLGLLSNGFASEVLMDGTYVYAVNGLSLAKWAYDGTLQWIASGSTNSFDVTGLTSGGDRYGWVGASQSRVGHTFDVRSGSDGSLLGSLSFANMNVTASFADYLTPDLCVVVGGTSDILYLLDTTTATIVRSRQLREGTSTNSHVQWTLDPTNQTAVVVGEYKHLDSWMLPGETPADWVSSL